ncbi:MAG TPA: chloride channel protein [Caldimonas sp.]|nr:chloride channel protein [Caldimonas sp.]
MDGPAEAVPIDAATEEVARRSLLIRVARTAQLWVTAAVAGALAAGAALGFRWLTQQVEWAVTGHRGGLVAIARELPPWHRALVCAAGGLLAGIVLAAGRRWASRGPAGVVNLDYIDAARAGRVDLNDRTTLSRTASALVSVGTGASIGREGAMVQLGAWFASWLARLAPIPEERRPTIMVCGIAAGIGAAYHAPIAGLVFVLELALGFFARHRVAPTLIAAATSSGIIYWLADPRPLYAVPDLTFVRASLFGAVFSGLIFGGIGWALLQLLDQARRRFARIASLPLRLGAGGVLVGLLSAVVPEVWGNGYSAVAGVFADQFALQALALIFVTKVVATALSSGSGAIGGIFTPSLFVGATAGSLLAQIAGLWLPATIVGDPRVLAIIGMASVLTAVTHAPLMSIVMVLEMTQQFHLTAPIMLACGAAYAVSTRFGVRPLYGNPIEGHQQ